MGIKSVLQLMSSCYSFLSIRGWRQRDTTMHRQPDDPSSILLPSGHCYMNILVFL